ncbi:MAG: ABC transporter permease [Bacteroidota bacterium]
MSKSDADGSSNICLLGYDVAKKLFREGIERAVNAVVRINNVPFRVLGVLTSRGSSFGFNRDNMIITSYNNIERNFPNSNSYVIAIMTNNILQVGQAMGERKAVQAIRKLATTEENNFVLDRSDSVAEKAMNSLGFLTISATVIG